MPPAAPPVHLGRRCRDWLPTPVDPPAPRPVPAAVRVHRSRGELLPDAPTGLPVRALAGLLLNVIVLTAVAAFLGLAIAPRTGEYRTLTMLTGSMRPGFPPGSVVVVTPQPVKDLRAGDVITFHAPTPDRRVVTHRVVSVDRSGPRPAVVTKGDANVGIDPWTATLQEDTVWQARFAVPHLGRAIIALRDPRTQLALTKVLPVVLVAWLLASIWRKDAEDAKDTHNA